MRVASGGWTIDAATQSYALRDGMYGLGGVSFRGAVGAFASFRIGEARHHRVELSYLAMPLSGKLSVVAHGKPIGTVDTSAPRQRPAYAGFAIHEGTRHVRIEVAEGSVRMFGINFERTTPGVVYHSLGLNGAYISVLARMFQEEPWALQLRHYAPDLVIVNYGTNESVYAEFIDTTYARELKEVIRRVRSAVPRASILVMSPMDRGRREMGSIDSVPVLPRLVAMQERLAIENGCAFFNTFHAMGGPGTMGRWYRSQPRLVSSDFIHPLPAGARIVGNLLFESLMKGYREYKLRRPAEIAQAAAATAEKE